jgi:hypothetical protein
MTSVNHLQVLAPGAILREPLRSNEQQFVVSGGVAHFTFLTLHLDDIPLDNTDRDRCPYTFCIHLLLYIFSGSAAQGGLLISRGLLITHNDAPQSVGLLWTSDQSVAETST